MIRRRLMVAWLLLAAGTEALRAPMHHRSPHRGSRRASAPVSAIWDRLRRTTPEGATEETVEEQSSEPRADGPTLLADEKAYSAKIAEAEAGNRVVVIKFYASWCRACKAMAPKFSRVAEDWPAWLLGVNTFVRTAIPPPLCYPLSDAAFTFVRGTLRLFHGFTWGDKLAGVADLLSALAAPKRKAGGKNL